MTKTRFFALTLIGALAMSGAAFAQQVGGGGGAGGGGAEVPAPVAYAVAPGGPTHYTPEPDRSRESYCTTNSLGDAYSPTRRRSVICQGRK